MEAKKVHWVALSIEGREPFKLWLNGLDYGTQGIIHRRLNRISSGNWGDVKSVGLGIFEIRIHYGPGYRIYFGFITQRNIAIILGGDKGSQRRDILRAQKYWQAFLTGDYDE